MSEPGEAAWSLRGRLGRRILLVVGIAWCAILATGLAVMWHEMGEIADEALEARAGTLAGLLARSDDGPASLAGERGVWVRIIEPGAEPPDAPWSSAEADDQRQIGDWTVVRATTPDGAVVEIGDNGRGHLEDFWEAAQVWLLATVPLLGLLSLAVAGSVRGVLAPVTAFAAAMERRRASDLSPTPGADLPAELQPIPGALDRYLARIEALLQAERDFSANAAHELRTPLAIASAQAQLIAEGRAGPDAARTVVAAVRRLTATIERLLDLAQAEAGSSRPGERCDVLRVLRLLIAEAPAGQVRFDDGDIESMDIAADADSVGLLLGNLLRNAREHGTGVVRVTVGPGAVVTVANPVAPGATFVEGRFATGPGSRGSGLGLSIARATANRFGWSLDLAVDGGVATARVAFDAARPEPAPPAVL